VIDSLRNDNSGLEFICWKNKARETTPGTRISGSSRFNQNDPGMKNGSANQKINFKANCIERGPPA
jgi:hypothetical protein